MRVTIRDVTYDDVHEAARALGVTTATVYCGVISGNIEKIGLGQRGRQRPKGSGKPPKPITVAGRKFASIADLARSIDRPVGCVRRSLRGGETAQRRIVLAVMKLIAKDEQAEAKRRMVED